ncbi:hypothetical protein V1520DRAFT_367699 [Lipomyces starkeyi]
MRNDEELRVHQIIPKLIFMNEPDKYSYDKFKAEFMKDEENDSYPRLFYDWTRQVVTIVTVPSHLHEETSSAILNSIYSRVESIMQHEQVQLAADEKLVASHSPRTLVNDGHSSYHMEPDGVIFFRTRRSLSFKVVVKAGVSQTYDSLEEKARKWIFGKKYIFIYLRARWMSALNEAFIEVVRINPDPEGTEVLLKRKYVLIHEGVNESSNVPRSVGDIRLGEVMPRESLGNEAAGDIVVDFFSAVDFMHIVRNAMIDTAVDRECRENNRSHSYYPITSIDIYYWNFVIVAHTVEKQQTVEDLGI